MKLNFNLYENDYLQHQLFVASKSTRVAKQRRKSTGIVFLSFLALSFLCYISDNKFMMYGFLIGSILSIIFYPNYLKQHYYKHYRRFISDTYKNRFNEPIEVIFTESTINCIDITGETKINLSSLEEITETEKYIYLKIKTGGHLIIPKSKIEDIKNVELYLVSLALRLKINYHKEFDWKWR